MWYQHLLILRIRNKALCGKHQLPYLLRVHSAPFRLLRWRPCNRTWPMAKAWSNSLHQHSWLLLHPFVIATSATCFDGMCEEVVASESTSIVHSLPRKGVGRSGRRVGTAASQIDPSTGWRQPSLRTWPAIAGGIKRVYRTSRSLSPIEFDIGLCHLGPDFRTRELDCNRVSTCAKPWARALVGLDSCSFPSPPPSNSLDALLLRHHRHPALPPPIAMHKTVSAMSRGGEPHQFNLLALLLSAATVSSLGVRSTDYIMDVCPDQTTGSSSLPVQFTQN